MRSGAGLIWLTFREHRFLRTTALLSDGVQALD
ncbi:hypothetical protein ACVWZ4_003410 [Bradyrhizobium sp. USDA 4472]